MTATDSKDENNTLMSDITIVQFESTPPKEETYVSELEDGPPFTVSGVALGEGDVTTGASGIKKKWPAEELEKAAESLQGTNLVVDHENSANGVVGRVTKAGYKEGTGVIYEAELYDEELAKKVKNGLLEVSVRGYHAEVDSLEEDEETGAKIVEDITFDNLSIVPSGASPSNTLEMGEHEELSEAELRQFTETLDELQEFEAGEWVQWDGGDKHGITISQPEDGEIEVDVYEKVDGTWRAIGQTETVPVSELEEWDVDEEEVGSAKDDDSSDDSSEDEEESAENEADDGEETSKHDVTDNDVLTILNAYAEEHGVERLFALLNEAIPSAELQRNEGEERPLDSQSKREDSHENQPERYPEKAHDMEEASADEGKPEDDSMSDVEELQEYEFHKVDWDGTTTSDWSSPDKEDFDTDDLSEIDDHYLISSSGFPPDTFGDLGLPVVEPNGDLNVNALAAVKGGRGVSAVEGLSDDMQERILDYVNKLANDEFDKNWGEDEEENESAESHDIDGTHGRPTGPTKSVGGVQVLSGDDLQQGNKSGESDVDSLTQYKVTNMTESIEEKISGLDNPVAVEQDEVDELRDKANRFEEMSENLEALRERTDILDEVDRSQVEELAETDEPVVVDSSRYEELQSEAEQVKTVYAASLAEEMPAFDAEELADKFSIEELREKFEEHVGDVEEELTSSESAEPRSQDADEESLEEAAGDEDEEAEELSEEVEAKQQELRDKILGGD